MRYFIPLLAVLAALLTGCNAEPVPTGTPHESARLTAYFDFDTTGWVMQDKEEVAEVFNLLSAGNVSVDAKDIIGVYGRTDTTLQHPFFMIFDMEMGTTPKMSDIEKVMKAQPMNAAQVRRQLDESVGGFLADLEVGQPMMDYDRKMFVVRSTNPMPEGLVQTIATNFIVRNGMVNMTGAYLEGDEQGLLKAYGDVVESFTARRK